MFRDHTTCISFVKLSSTSAAYFLKHIYILQHTSHKYITEKTLPSQFHEWQLYMKNRYYWIYVTDIVEENLYILLEIHQQHSKKSRYWCWVFFSMLLISCTQSWIYDNMGQHGQGFAPENKLTYRALMNQYAHVIYWYIWSG